MTFHSVLRTGSSESRLAPYEFIPELRKDVFGNPGMGIIIKVNVTGIGFGFWDKNTGIGITIEITSSWNGIHDVG